MTTADLKRIRSEARSMTLEQLRDAHARALGMFARATTQEAAQWAHDAAGEYAEAFQNARRVSP